MNKEQRYQNEGQSFIEKQIEKYSGSFTKIYCEEFSTLYDDVLQEVSPLIGGNLGNYEALKTNFGIVGLREKINEFNAIKLTQFLTKYKKTDLLNETLEVIFQDFKKRYDSCEGEAQLYQLIFCTNDELKPDSKRSISIKGLKETFEYNVVHYEAAGNYVGKNSFYTIRERRIPIVMHQYKKTERPDFVHYINGIPLVIVEYKTEDSGILNSLKDFEYKESYKKAPFKIALNDGRDVVFFSDIRFLKFKTGKDNSFNWVHYLSDKKNIGTREFTNIEYLFDELLCQPENMYSYCLDCCSVVDSNNHYYLTNARIQQYYAIKDIKKTLIKANDKQLSLPYNFEFAHAQRSGKTITMKLICYMIEKQFGNVFNTIFMYTPDLQIKDVINTELSKSGHNKITVKMVESRAQYQGILEQLYIDEQNNKLPTSLTIYIVNMQKITDKDLQLNTHKTVLSSRVLNIIDEAHHGQTKETAIIRDTIFPNASNYLFTATGKNDMYLYYFPDNQRNGFSNKFSITNAKQCKITVPVAFLRAEKTFVLSEKLASFAQEVQKRMGQNYINDGFIAGIDKEDIDIDSYEENSNSKISQEIKRRLSIETIEEKIDYIVQFMDSVRDNLSFFPKAIVYVNSVEDAKRYIGYIQNSVKIPKDTSIAHNPKNNDYFGYRFATDFSSIKEICNQLNPGINEPELISGNFQKERNGKTTGHIIDILFAVDKYQKGFDLPTLLVTFLDTNIGEPARMNQIFTRSATKFTGKTTGYCVDLSFENVNPHTFKQSLLLYDNADNASDSFIDDEVLEKLKNVLAIQFKELMRCLNLTENNFTSSMILQQVLNEVDLTLRKQRQYSFFTISKNIISNMSKMGSPLFFKPFKLELKALNDAFNEFRVIYGDKHHSEYHKILINTDSSLGNNGYITNEEIRSVISQVLNFLNEHNIKDLVNFDYTNKNKEVIIDEDSKKEVVQKFSQELKKNNVEKDLDSLSDYLRKNHKDLFDMIKDMLSKISEDRNLIYEEYVQEKLTQIQSQLNDVKISIVDTIAKDYNGNSFLFWSNETANNLLNNYGVKQPEFVSYLTNKVYSTMHIVFPQIEKELSNYYKVQMTCDMFKDKIKAETFSFYLTDYAKQIELSSSFKAEVKNAPDYEGQKIMVSKSLFSLYLTQTLRQYYQNVIKG